VLIVLIVFVVLNTIIVRIVHTVNFVTSALHLRMTMVLTFTSRLHLLCARVVTMSTIKWMSNTGNRTCAEPLVFRGRLAARCDRMNRRDSVKQKDSMKQGDRVYRGDGVTRASGVGPKLVCGLADQQDGGAVSATLKNVEQHQTGRMPRGVARRNKLLSSGSGSSGMTRMHMLRSTSHSLCGVHRQKLSA
jgi:hypothetical protein